MSVSVNPPHVPFFLFLGTSTPTLHSGLHSAAVTSSLPPPNPRPPAIVKLRLHNGPPSTCHMQDISCTIPTHVLLAAHRCCTRVSAAAVKHSCLRTWLPAFISSRPPPTLRYSISAAYTCVSIVRPLICLVSDIGDDDLRDGAI